jgi:hypothetical protein
VCLEAARVLAARASPRWSLMVMFTDGEEDGLLGAAALLDDEDVRARLKTVINVEAMGGDSPVPLFEAGPGNGWLTGVWARAAPRPRGGSVNYEIYRRMPNDTDFSVFKAARIPGLNLAATGDIYTYHSALESPARVTSSALGQAGATVVAVVDALQSEDITRRTADEATYFDVLRLMAVAWSPRADLVLLALAIGLGLAALSRAALDCVRAGGLRVLALSVAWALVAAAVISGAAVGSAALLRAVREVYHPWHAHPWRFATMVVLSGASAGWLLARLSPHLPAALRLPRRAGPVIIPTLALWVALAALSGVMAPRAAYLFVLPLLAMAAPIAASGAGPTALRMSSGLALVAAAALWLPDTMELFPFLVALLAGFPTVTPIWVLPAVLLLAALVVVPPAIALAIAVGVRRPRFATRGLLVAAGFALAWAYHAPAFTPDRPMRLALVSVSGERGHPGTTTMIAGNEPAPALPRGAPQLTPVPEPPPAFRRYTGRAAFTAVAPAEAARQGGAVTCAADGDRVAITVVPPVEGTRARLELPVGLEPLDASPPGVQRDGTWVAIRTALPAEGTTFRLRLPAPDAGRACDGRVLLSRPRPVDPATGALPGWLTSPGLAWDFRVVDVLPLR